MEKKVIIFTTTETEKEAEKIANALLEDRIAACVNIIPKIRSRYWWQGKIEKSGETLLLIKTKENLVSRVEERIKSLHSYECPEVVAIEISEGSADYLDWIEQTLI
ncbi:MAG: divalent-cation tolerance protein CutA [Acidobacteria bacterium]|nr:divalent-cation tolerance protein CutA [Acidobacteriota bacterium]